MKNVIFIAPPATGKGTISKYLVDNFGYSHISTGELLRSVSKQDTEIGKKVASLINNGMFVSDELVLDIIKEYLKNRENKTFILDGIPRNILQAEYMEKLFVSLGVDNYVVINLDIDKETLKKRATGRRVCNNCRLSYNIYFDEYKPLLEDKCDNCQNDLQTRKDDTLEIFESRYLTYLENTLPVIDFYQKKSKLATVDANQSNEKLLNDVINIIKGE